MKAWDWLNGKKSIIGGILSLTVGFLQAKNVIDGETATYMLAITGLILGIGIGHKIVKK